jgi:L-serine kinase (ADP)
VTTAREAPEGPVFRLLRLSELKDHEQVDPKKVDELVENLRRTQVVADPIWVAAGSGVILNGHHRVAALRLLGAERAPAWVIDYASPEVRLERWTAGPPIPKAEVVRRAGAHELFPPKTTRHIVVPALASRSTPLSELMRSDSEPGAGAQPRASRSPRRGAARSEST